MTSSEALSACIDHVFKQEQESAQNFKDAEADMVRSAEEIGAEGKVSWFKDMDPLTKKMEIALQHQMMDEVSKEMGMFGYGNPTEDFIDP